MSTQSLLVTICVLPRSQGRQRESAALEPTLFASQVPQQLALSRTYHDASISNHLKLVKGLFST